MISEYRANRPKYQKMKNYYDGKHDILNTYPRNTNYSNQIVVTNMINPFITQEVSYVLGNPISYISNTGDKEVVNAINSNLFHYKSNHNQELMKQLEIYGTAYELSYIDKKGRFCSRILNPLNAICYVDEDNIPQLFIHFYKKKFHNEQYHDVYYTDGRIEIYKDDKLINTTTHIFEGVPVSVCSMDIEETIFCKINKIQDAYNWIMSDQVNLISSYKNSYLIISGARVDDEVAETLRREGIINLESKDGNATWLTKDINDEFIENSLNRLKNSMYEITNHIDSTEPLQSNTSGAALRNRLTFLEQRCESIFDVVLDTIYNRLEFLFQYLAIKNKEFNIQDVHVQYKPNIPVDTTAIVNENSQLSDGLSLETKLSRLPFVQDPQQEIEKIKQERKELEEIDLDKINLF